MNEKHAKALRRQARAACLERGIPLDTRYRVVPKTVDIDSLRRARTYGLVGDFVLAHAFGDGTLSFVRPQVILGVCLRGVVQRTKRALHS